MTIRNPGGRLVQAADDTAQEDESALFAGYREPDRPHAGV
jgi:hypothetical protein